MSASRSEISDLTDPAFSGMALDRAATLRGDPAWIAQRLQEPTARVLAAGHNQARHPGAAPSSSDGRR
jgi:hypothetical protein